MTRLEITSEGLTRFYISLGSKGVAELTNETTSGSWLLSLGRHKHKVGNIELPWQKALQRALDYLEAMPNAQETTTIQGSITV